MESSGYEALGITPIENTAREILDITMEAEERLKGTWQPAPDDEILQQRFWSLFPPSEFHGEFNSRIGAAFLRENRDLLE